MLKRRCPFVGLCGDPDTVVAFASTRNCCNRVENPGPIRLAYQHSHCFTFDHRRCEVLLQEHQLNELPPEITAFPTRKRAVIIVGSAASLVVTAIFLVIFFGWWQPAGAIDQDRVVPSTLQPTQNFGGEITPTNLDPTATPADLAVMEMIATETLLPTFTATEPLPPTEKSVVPTKTLGVPTTAPTTCGAPSGWGIYVVRVGDTLSSIAAVQGITVTQLQNANCLTTAAVYVGQRLYVPYPLPITSVPTSTAIVPTATALLTWTPLPSSTPMPTQAPTLAPTQPPTLVPSPTEMPPNPTHTSVPIPTNTTVPLPTNPPAPTATPTPISLPANPTP